MMDEVYSVEQDPPKGQWYVRDFTHAHPPCPCKYAICNPDRVPVFWSDWPYESQLLVRKLNEVQFSSIH